MQGISAKDGLRRKYNVTPEQFIRAGRLAIVNAVITIPLFLLSIMLGLQGDYGARALQTILMVASTLLFVYIILVLKELINSRHGFHDTDIPSPDGARIVV